MKTICACKYFYFRQVKFFWRNRNGKESMAKVRIFDGWASVEKSVSKYYFDHLKDSNSGFFAGIEA
jgi:hypothetical protein